MDPCLADSSHNLAVLSIHPMNVWIYVWIYPSIDPTINLYQSIGISQLPSGFVSIFHFGMVPFLGLPKVHPKSRPLQPGRTGWHCRDCGKPLSNLHRNGWYPWKHGWFIALTCFFFVNSLEPFLVLSLQSFPQLINGMMLQESPYSITDEVSGSVWVSHWDLGEILMAVMAILSTKYPNWTTQDEGFQREMSKTTGNLPAIAFSLTIPPLEKTGFKIVDDHNGEIRVAGVILSINALFASVCIGIDSASAHFYSMPNCTSIQPRGSVAELRVHAAESARPRTVAMCFTGSLLLADIRWLEAYRNRPCNKYNILTTWTLQVWRSWLYVTTCCGRRKHTWWRWKLWWCWNPHPFSLQASKFTKAWEEHGTIQIHYPLVIKHSYWKWP